MRELERVDGEVQACMALQIGELLASFLAKSGRRLI